MGTEGVIVNGWPEPTWDRRHPPFERGNAVALRHGVWSDRRIDPVAVELTAAVFADRPDLKAYPEVVAAWARAEARCLLIDGYLVQHGLVDDTGKPHPILAHVVRFENLAARLRERLGLDPLSDAQLARERVEATHAAVDLDALRARGRDVLEAREVTK